MFQSYRNLGLSFCVGNTRFHALNFIYEQFRRSIPSHVHGNGSYEIHYIPEGYGTARINGSDYEIRPNTLYITGPHVEHAQTPLAEHPMCEYCIYLKTGGRFSPSVSCPETAATVLRAFESTPFWFGQDAQQTGSLILELFQILEERKTGWELLAEALLIELLVRLVRNYEKESADTEVPQASRADQTSVIIEEYFLYQYQNLSLAELSRSLGLGARQTERLLQKQYGKTFLQKKTEARMSAAAILLSDPGRSITSVAEDLGYSSVEHFSSAFRSYYHTNPRQYRQRLKERSKALLS